MVYNEHMLILASWLTALILCKLIAEDRKERRDYRKQAAYSVVRSAVLQLNTPYAGENFVDCPGASGAFVFSDV